MKGRSQMSLQGYYDNFRSGYWADSDPSKCACHGHGYALSEVDTWHECPIHHVKGQLHPEDDCDGTEEGCYEVEAAPAYKPEPVTFDDDSVPF